MLSLDKYIQEDKNEHFVSKLNVFKKRSFSVNSFGQNNINTEKGLRSQEMHGEVMEKYKTKESQGEMLSMKLKNFY